MHDQIILADVLRRYMREKHWSLERLALSSGVSKKTIHNWLKPDGVRKPHTWQPLLLIARTLGLDKGELSALLQAAQQPPMPRLLELARTPQDRALLQPWALSTPHNLPSPATSLIGRDAEIEALSALLHPSQSSARLVLLTGPGGSGKTRLSLAVAHELLDYFKDGVFFVDLVAIDDPALVGSAIADVLGVAEIAHATLPDALKQHLRQRQTLLLLDNFEQALDAAPLVAELLAAAPGLRILVTSRVVLRLSGEHEFNVAPLALPDLSDLPPPVELARYPAVALFLQRVQAVKPGFQLTADNARAVAEICARLDGLPLAIELAAARVKVLAPAALLERLRDASGAGALRLLSDGPRDLPARHQTLAATIDWSYALLDPAAQRLFARLAVFCGGALDQIEAVCASLDGQPGDALEGLAALIDSSLLFQSDGSDGQPRFLLLAMIREFAWTRLIERGEAEATRRAHAAVYAALASESVQYLCGPDQQRWLRRLKAEHDNLRAALRWTIASGDSSLALQLGAALWAFWGIHSHFSEGRQWLAQIMALPDILHNGLWGQVVQGAGELAARQGDYAQAEQLLAQAHAYWQAHDDRARLAETLNRQGGLARQQGDYDRAARLHQQALELERADGDRHHMVHTLRRLGRTAIRQGDPDRAQQLFDQANALDNEPNDTMGLAIMLHDLGDLAYAQGNYARAADLWRQALAQREELEDRQGIAQTHWCLGRAALGRRDLAEAQQRLSVSLRLCAELADTRGMIDSLIGLSIVAARQGMPLQAARLAGAEEALREGLSASAPAVDQPALQAALEAARAHVDRLSWTAAWLAGRTMSIDQLIAELDAAPSPALSLPA